MAASILDVCRFAVNIVLAAQERHDALNDQVISVLAGLGSYLQTLQVNFKKGKFIDLDFSEKRPGDVAAIKLSSSRRKATVRRSRFIADLTEDRNGFSAASSNARS